MLIKLKDYYKDLFITSEVADNEQYQWFQNEFGELFGIHKSVGNEEIKLLSVLFQSIQMVESKMTKTEKEWQNILLGKKTEIPFLPVRFVYFTLDKEIENLIIFEEALDGILYDEHCIIWKNALEGVIIEKYQNDDIEYESIVDIVATDFYTNMWLYVGNVQKAAESFYIGIEIEKKCIQFAKRLNRKKRVRTINELIPMILVEEIPNELKSNIWKVVLKDTIQDKELLDTIIIFLQNNLNVSQTAKKQFLHRNSVQYRVDKFIEKTGIDVRTFDGAALVHLALIILNDNLYNVHKE